MDIEDKYDELDNIESTLRILTDEIENAEYKDILMELMYKAQDEKEEIEPILQKMRDEEEKEQERQYWNSQF